MPPSHSPPRHSHSSKPQSSRHSSHHRSHSSKHHVSSSSSLKRLNAGPSLATAALLAASAEASDRVADVLNGRRTHKSSSSSSSSSTHHHHHGDGVHHHHSHVPHSEKSHRARSRSRSRSRSHSRSRPSAMHPDTDLSLHESDPLLSSHAHAHSHAHTHSSARARSRSPHHTHAFTHNSGRSTLTREHDRLFDDYERGSYGRDRDRDLRSRDYDRLDIERERERELLDLEEDERERYLRRIEHAERVAMRRSYSRSRSRSPSRAHLRYSQREQLGLPDTFQGDALFGTVNPNVAYGLSQINFDSGIMKPADEEDKEFDLQGDIPDSTLPGVGRTAPPKLSSSLTCCPLCGVLYQETGSACPRSLLCGHTFCTQCFTSILDNLDPTDLAHTAKAGQLPCPNAPNSNCVPTPLPENGISGLQVNTAFLEVGKFMRARRAAGHGLNDLGAGDTDDAQLIEAIKELEMESKKAEQFGGSGLVALPCQQCELHMATLFCQSCNIRFCAACSASIHVGRALSAHVKRGNVLPLPIARARGLLNTAAGNLAPRLGPAVMCTQHPDQVISLFCRTCSTVICRDCVTPLFKGVHLPPGHDVDLLSNVLAGTRAELRNAVQAIEGNISKLDSLVASAGSSVSTLTARANDVTRECKDAFALIRSAVLKCLDDREHRLIADIQKVVSSREQRVHTYRAELTKLLNHAKAAREEGVKTLSSNEIDIYAIKALTDVRTALNTALPTDPEKTDGRTDILFKCQPRDLIRLVETQIQKQGGVIASIPLPCTFTSFTCIGTSCTLTWTPASHPNQGEVFEYILEVCELPRNWRSHLKTIQPSLFPNPIDPVEELEDEKWNGAGQLLARSRAAINWCCVPTSPLQLGGAELVWRLVGGAGWTGIYTPLYTGELNTVKHENLQVNAAYIYRVAVKNDLGVSDWTYSWPCTLPCMRLGYNWDMDNGGLVSYFGSCGGTSTWASPLEWIGIEASSTQIGDVNTLIARQATTFQTLNRHLSWIKLDLFKKQPYRLLITHYTLANCGRGPASKRTIRSWLLQGSDDAINWVTLKEHVKDETLHQSPNATATWSVNPPSSKPYRYFRIMQTDVNAAQDHQLSIGQIELYGYLVRDEDKVETLTYVRPSINDGDRNFGIFVPYKQLPHVNTALEYQPSAGTLAAAAAAATQPRVNATITHTASSTTLTDLNKKEIQL